MNMQRDPIDQFADALAAREIVIPREIRGDGEFHRADVNGPSGKGDATYILHLDGVPAGSICNWRDGLGWQSWRADVGRQLTDAERAALKAKAESDRLKREQDEKRRRDEAKTQAQAFMATQSVAAPADHPYIVRKGIQPYKLRVFTGHLELHGMQCRSALMVGLLDEQREVAALQFIGEDGEKRYLGPTQGRYYPIGKLEPDKPLLICEGLATGHSLHECIGHAVAVALDAGNLVHVGKLFRDRYPNARLIYCADDDWKTLVRGQPKNVGLLAAQQAARATGGLVAVPDFSGVA